MSDAAQLGLRGGLPGVRIEPGNPEALKYGRLWDYPEYRKVAPGEGLAALFLQVAQPRSGSEVLDLGCGTGRGALMLALLGGCRVTMVDFVGNCLDPEIREALTTQAHALRFVKADLTRRLPVAAQYGYCTDVLEHIPPARMDDALDAILTAAQHVFVSISTVEDQCGALIGERLHLTVRPYGWWLHQFAQRDAVIHWSREEPTRALFYLTAWRTGREVAVSGQVNVTDAEIRANVAANLARRLPSCIPHAPNNLEIAILGGGPSLAGFEAELRAHRAAGVNLVTLNGAYGWALDRQLGPVNQVMVDARPFNARFVRPADPRSLYLLASQCHPDVFADLPPDRIHLWHTNPALIHDLLNAAYPEGWHSIPGGSTVLLRAIPLLRMLGYRRFHLYGCDSCLDTAGGHHAYAQPENNRIVTMPVVCGGRVFWCHGWMVSQAQEFMQLIRALGDELEIEVHGDGLLRWILETGAQCEADSQTDSQTVAEAAAGAVEGEG